MSARLHYPKLTPLTRFDVCTVLGDVYADQQVERAWYRTLRIVFCGAGV